MRVHNLNKVTHRAKKRVGRGPGSGKGKTGGRGYNGQRARNTIRIGFEGGQARLALRVPLLRGRDFKSIQTKPTLVTLTRLNDAYDNNSVVSLETLQNKKLIKSKTRPVKILANGEIEKKLTISKNILTSTTAKEKIEKAGGKVLA